MEINRVHLSLGSNLGDRIAYLQKAIDALNEFGRVSKCSSVYETSPWGFECTSPFLNICIIYDTSLSAKILMDKITVVEHSLGRIRHGEQYQSRTIDIDIVFYNNEIFETEQLIIPHIHYRKRSFVLLPLAEISPDHTDPRDSKKIKELINDSNLEGCVLKTSARLNY